MLRKSVLAVLCALLLGPALSAFAGLDPDLVAWWTFDEGQGTVAADSSDNGNDGTLMNSPTWVDGKLDMAIKLGSGSYVSAPYIALDNRSFTIAMWINPVLTSSAVLFGQAQTGSANQSMHYRFGGPSSTDAPVRGVRMGFYSNDTDSPANIFQDNTWYHVAFWYDYDAKIRRIYVDGAQVAEGTSVSPYLGTAGNTTIGYWATNTGQTFTGIVDDAQIYHRALTEAEIARIMTGLMDASLASKPAPSDGATDVHQDAALSWAASQTAATHDVYFGTSAADVEAASRDNPMDVLVSQDQADTAFDPAGLLEFGQTYYWRIDEVNAAPDNTIVKGGVWSFTAEPYAYPVTPIAATASSVAPKQGGPGQTIGGIGLNADDQHSIDGAQMWMASALPAWIQYEFATVCKLDKMLVWNYNLSAEFFMGFGAKTVTVEYSLDGETWEALADVPEFAQAPGADTYTADTTVEFGGLMAKYVRLTITDNWGPTQQVGLSEVRFYAAPVQAREPVPAVAATGVSIDTDLDWRPGRGAMTHDVYLGTDSNSVRDAVVATGTVADHGYSPAGLTFATEYFWRIDEVGEDGAVAGDVWSFTTQDFAPIDDFEVYNDSDNYIFDTWADGYIDHSSGSTVGYIDSVAGTFGERTVIHGGAQSMPLTYDNTASPYYSETVRTFDSPQNWTTNGADSVTLFYQGITPNFVETASGHILMNGIGSDIWGTADQFHFAYKTLTGNGTMVARIHSLYDTPGNDGWSKAGVMIRQSLEPGSVHGFTALTSRSGNGASFQRRLTIGGDSTNNDADVNSPATKPYWVKVERVGDAFSSYISADGVTWTQLGTAQTIAMTGPVMIGLAVCSHTTAAATGADFSDIKTTGNVTGSWQLADIGVMQQEGNSAQPLYLTIKDSAGKSKTFMTSDIASALMGWQQWTVPLSEMTAAGVKTNSVKSVTIGVGNRTTPAAGGTGKIYIDDLGYGRPLP